MDYWHSSQNGGARKMSRMGSFSSSQVGVILQLKRERAQSVAKSRLLLSTVWLSKQLRQSYLVGFRFFVLDSFSCRRVLLLQRSGHHLGW